MTDPKIKKYNKAIPKLAPELIPNVVGPASGFLNIVWIPKPDREHEIPINIDRIVLGNLEVTIISKSIETGLIIASNIETSTEPNNNSEIVKMTNIKHNMILNFLIFKNN